MNDIVEMLRFGYLPTAIGNQTANQDALEAADEIENLRSDIARHIEIASKQADEIEGLRLKLSGYAAGATDDMNQIVQMGMELERHRWQDIKIYDAMKKKPELCVFRFAATKPARHRGDFLREAFQTERTMGRRVCTSFYVLTTPPEGGE